MRFLIDNNLSARLAPCLKELGIEASHVRALGLQASADSEVVQAALESGSVLVTADSDFPEMLALSGATGPSVLYLTGDYPTQPEPLAILLANQVALIEKELDEGAVVALSSQRMRLRKLPI
ncbi:MAG: DUF5615 family PIN-like protein [Armatimonadetes bacterium]|nr:DUF5615 family PIN-like protein [Armatimonadota bacterium]